MLTPERIEGIYDYIGARIRSERIEANLSQEELGLRVGLTRTSISNIELGQQKVQIHTLYEIASLLNVPLTALLPPSPSQVEVEERYLKKLSLGERGWVKSIMSALQDKEISEKSVAKKVDIDRDPEKLLQQAGVDTPPVPVEHIAHQCGAQIQYAPYEGDLSGLLFRNKEQIIIGLNSLDPKVRQRFAIAHELGHLALHEGQELHIDRTFSASRGQGASKRVDRIEDEANDFATNLLIPTSMIKVDLKGKPVDFSNGEVMAGLASRYKVGLEIMVYRLMKLNLIYTSSPS